MPEAVLPADNRLLAFRADIQRLKDGRDLYVPPSFFTHSASQVRSASIEIEVAIEIGKLPKIDHDNDFDTDFDTEHPVTEEQICPILPHLHP
ncbi:hypothetical protein [Desulfonatronum thioautotrophicum]|uniref:hypothetical protein n=1 Tax=Desulfonatronum thioautotrophicum TaxID=617001 RepID=UPI00129481EA|nr:hypothetical protein [Desulfonatronum thioautotrophicum]